MQQTVYWIWLSQAVTPGSDTFRKLLNKFEYPKAIYNADDTQLASCIGSKSRDYEALCNKDLSGAESILDFCTRKSVGILTYDDEAFPNSLREITTPPVLLYYRGILPDFNKNCFVAMVGTRRLTDYGRRNAFQIGYDLAAAGATIVSGMAIGIDGVSHAGSLAAGGINVAFLGSGIDVCYPEQHKRLAREIVKNGCVLTEYAPGVRPNGYHFPVRNRLIAGVSCATVVIEGHEKSGALITARHAKEFGKTVYALPGNVDNKTSAVSNMLIKNGAKLITSADDIVEELEFVYLGIINPFNLLEKLPVRMNDVLSNLEIACVSQGDKIFSTYPSKKNSAEKKEEKHFDIEPESREITESASDEGSRIYDNIVENVSFDKNTLRIYKKIPPTGDCNIDSLVDNDDKMPDVMKALLKLEMGSFVIMLPGERVQRKFK